MGKRGMDREISSPYQSSVEGTLGSMVASVSVVLMIFKKHVSG